MCRPGCILLVLTLVCTSGVPVAAQSIIYHFLPGSLTRYHLHRRSRISAMQKHGLSYREVTLDADAEVRVDSVYPAGDAILDITVGNINEQNTERGHWTLTRITLIPHSRLRVSATGRILEGAILQEDTARSTSKQLEDKVAFREIRTMSDRKALQSSLNYWLPRLRLPDSIFDGQTWKDTVYNGKHTSTNDYDTKIYGRSEPVVEQASKEVQRNEYMIHSIVLKTTYSDRQAWRHRTDWTAEGKEDWAQFKEEGHREQYFFPGTNIPVGYTESIERHRDDALLEFTTEVKTTAVTRP